MFDFNTAAMFLMDDAVMGAPPEAPAAGGTFDSSYVATVINNVSGYVKTVGSYIILLIGIAVLCIAIFQITKALASPRGGTNWLVTIGCLFFGGFLTFGGWSKIAGGFIGSVGKNTADELISSSPSTTPDASVATTYSGVASADSGINAMLDMFFFPFATTLCLCVGVVLILIAVYKLTTFFFGNGRGRISWAQVAIISVLGSILFAAAPTDSSAGWDWVRDTFTGVTRDTIVNMADGNSGSETDGFSSNGFQGGGDDGTTDTGEGDDAGTDSGDSSGTT